MLSGLALMLWLSGRIRAVWRGEKHAPSIPPSENHRYPLREYALGVPDRMFPMLGAVVFCIGGFALALGLTNVVGWLGVSALQAPLNVLAVVMLVAAVSCSTMVGAISLTGRPKLLIPPPHRNESGDE